MGRQRRRGWRTATRLGTLGESAAGKLGGLLIAHVVVVGAYDSCHTRDGLVPPRRIETGVLEVARGDRVHDVVSSDALDGTLRHGSCCEMHVLVTRGVHVESSHTRHLVAVKGLTNQTVWPHHVLVGQQRELHIQTMMGSGNASIHGLYRRPKHPFRGANKEGRVDSGHFDLVAHARIVGAHEKRHGVVGFRATSAHHAPTIPCGGHVSSVHGCVQRATLARAHHKVRGGHEGTIHRDPSQAKHGFVDGDRHGRVERGHQIVRRVVDTSEVGASSMSKRKVRVVPSTSVLTLE